MQSSPPALPATEEQLLSPPGVPALEYSQLRNPTVQSNFRLPPAAITTTTTTTTTTTVTSASHMHNVAPMNSFVPTSVTAASESITGQDFRNSDNGGRRSRRTSNSNASPVHPHGGGGWDLTPSHTGVDNPLPGHHATFAPIASVRSNDHFGASLIFDTQADNMFQPNRHGTGYAPRRQSYFTSGGGMPGITVGASTPNSNPMAARVRQRSIAFGSLGPQNTTRNSSIATNASSGRTPGGRGSYSQISDTSDGRGVSFGQDGSTSNLEREEEIGASVFACTFLCRELQTTTYYVLKAVHQRVCLQDAPSSHTTLSSNGTDSTAEGVGSHENLSKLRRGSSAVQIRRTASSLNNRTIHSPSQSANLPKPAAESQPDLLKDLPVHKAVFGGASHADPWFPTDGRVSLALTMLQKLGHKSMQNIFAVANTSTHICAIGEFYIQGSIESCVGTYDFHKLGQFTKDMVRVLHYAHNHGIAHGHLTLSNVFLREAGQGTVIADFGLAHMFSNFSAQQLYDADYRDVGLFPPEKITQVAATSSASGVCEDEDEEEVDEMESSSASSCDPRSRQNGGTPKQMRRAEAHDLWALGCMIYQLASGSRGRAPFADTTGHVMGVTEERDALFHRIRTKEPDFSWCTDNNLADLLARLLDKNPRRRGPFLTVLRHPFIRTRVDVSRSLPAIKTDDSPLLQAANKRSASSSKQLQKPFQKGTGFHHQPIGSDDEERVMSDTKSDVGTSATISESPSFTEGSIQELLPIATGCNTKGHQSLAQCFSVASFRKQHSSAFGGFEKTFNAGGTVGALEKSMMPRPRGVLFSVEGFKCSHCGQQIKVASYQCAECPDFRVCRSCQFQQIFVHDPDHELICHAVDTTVDDGMAQSRSRRGTLMIPTSNLTEREATIFSMTGTLPVALDFERSTRGIARHHSMKVGGAVPISRNSSKRFDGEELGSTIIKSPGSPRSPLKECSSAGSLPSASINEEQSTEVKPRPQLMSGEEDENMMLEETPDALIDENLSSLAPDLMLADLQIVEFPFIIVNPPMAHLTILDLANNFLTSIPDDIEFLVNLRRLLLGNNKLTVLPETIGNLTDLETLDVNHNQLTSLPQSLMFCDQLEVLALDYNDFEEIPTLLVDIEVRQVYLAANPRISSWPSADDLQNFPKGITIGLDNEPHLFRDAPTVLAQCPNVHVLWNKIYPDEIIPNLYLGSLRTAQSQEIYQRLHLTHLLTMGRGLEPQAPEGGQHKIVIVDDIEGANIDFAFEEAIVFIEEALSQETGCLVHCFAGMSRSATTVIAYLMMKRGMRLDDAYCLTKKGRPAIYPNGGFFNQLLALDAKLYPGQRELNMPSMERDKKP